MKYLAVDYGSSKIGLAIGDDATRLALPFGVVENTGKGADTVVDVAVKEATDALVVGVPVPLAQEQGTRSLERVHRFIDALRERTDKPIFCVDESYTTRSANVLQEEGAEVAEDALAAMLILEDFFQQRNV